MAYFANMNPVTGITNANNIQAQVLYAFLSDPTVVSRQFPCTGTTTEGAFQVTYYGYALPGANENVNSWRIRKYVISGSTGANLYPNGDNLFSYSWTYRTGYTYA